MVSWHICDRWQLHPLHQSRFSCISVAGGHIRSPTCHGFVAYLRQVATPSPPPVTVSRHIFGRWTHQPSHLAWFHGISVTGGNFYIPPVTVSRRFCGRWQHRPPTCSGFPAFLWQVDTADFPPVMVFLQKYARWTMRQKSRDTALCRLQLVSDAVLMLLGRCAP